MQQIASYAFWRVAKRLDDSIRSDTPEHYIEDLQRAGIIELIKREIVT